MSITLDPPDLINQELISQRAAGPQLVDLTKNTHKDLEVVWIFQAAYALNKFTDHGFTNLQVYDFCKPANHNAPVYF